MHKQAKNQKQQRLILPKIVVICGPTASGKTDLAIHLAKKFNGEVVCADSRTVYRHMDIGTAKPVRKGQKQYQNRAGFAYYRTKNIPHYMLDVATPDKAYSVAQFKQDALSVIYDIIARKKLPFIVGGTGLYIRAIAENLEFPDMKADAQLRKNLEKELAQKGNGSLYKKLIALDPESKKFIDPKNPRRIIRALEVISLTKKKFSDQRTQGPKLFKVLKIGISVGKETLKQRISKRTDKMVKSGFLKEVKFLKKKYGCNIPSMSGIGYRQFCLFLDKKISLQEATDNFKRGDFLYAKRQMTWFRKEKNVVWRPYDIKKTETLVKKF